MMILYMVAGKERLKMVRYLPAFLLFLLVSLPLDAGARGFSMESEERFDWLPSECAHKQYPMKLIRGNLVLKDGSSLYVPAKAIIHNGWGELGSTHVVGENLKPLPVKLTATWFSYAEDKFFAGQFLLPYDIILDQFRKMISPSTGKSPTSFRIFIGFGPQGAVSVWVATEGRQVAEVGSYRATEVAVDWKAASYDDQTSRSDQIEEILGYCLTPQELRVLKEHGVPPGISDHYSKQYRWNVSVSGQMNPMLWLDTLNGEREYYDFSKIANIRSSRGLPKTMRILWEDIIGKKYGANISFDEPEVTAAYQKLSADKGDHPMQLQLEISDNPGVIHISLSDGKYVIRLKKTQVNAFRR